MRPPLVLLVTYMILASSNNDNNLDISNSKGSWDVYSASGSIDLLMLTWTNASSDCKNLTNGLSLSASHLAQQIILMHKQRKCLQQDGFCHF